jgi:hypothetical protein
MAAAGLDHESLARPFVLRLAAAIVIVWAVARLPLLFLRRFNPDEFEHLHAAWAVAQGQVPYRDFFQHHPPLFYAALAPVLALVQPEQSYERALAAIFGARVLIWICAAGILLLTFRLGALCGGRLTGALAAVAVTHVVMFQTKSLEVRPDGPALLLVLASAYAWARWGPPRAYARCALGGVALGASVMLTQKVLLLFPGFALATVYPLRGERDRSAMVRHAFAFWAGVMVAPALVLAWLGAIGALRPFLDANFVRVADWPVRVGPEGFARELLAENAPFLVLVLVGALALARQLRNERPSRAWVTVLAVGGAAAATLFALPIVTRQAGLPLFPPAAILAALGLQALAAAVSRGLGVAPARALAAMLLVASVQPYWLMAASFRSTNHETREALRFVMTASTPTQSVLDGFSGLGVFRPHAFPHYYLHAEIRALLGERGLAAIAADLAAARVTPFLVAWDRHVAGLPADALGFLGREYARAGPEPLHVRLFDNGRGCWDDSAARYLWSADVPCAPHVIPAHGWSPPRREGPRAFRVSTARRPRLLVPLRQAGPRRTLTLIGRATAGTVHAEVAVNGHPAGVVEMGEGTAAHALAVPDGALAPGLNAISFRLPEGAIELESLRLGPPGR